MMTLQGNVNENRFVATGIIATSLINTLLFILVLRGVLRFIYPLNTLLVARPFRILP